MNLRLKSCFFLGLLVFSGVVSSAGEDDDTGNRCKKEVVESYNLSGYLTPRVMSMYICPQLKNSCCSFYDQFLMYSTWRDKIKPKLVNYYDAMSSKLMKAKVLTKEVIGLNFPKMIQDLQIDDKKKEEHLSTFLRLNATNTDTLIDQVIMMQKDNARFMMKLRSSFYCSICDFDSHQYFDTNKKTFTSDFGTCSEIATNTINFSHFMTITLGGYLQSLSKLMSVFALSEAEKPVRIRTYETIVSQIKSCSNQVSQRTGKFVACKKYCEHWRINANSPVIEGYQLFMNSMISAMEKFVKDHGKEPRVLAEDGEREPSISLFSSEQPSDFHQKMTMDEPRERNLRGRVLSGENEIMFDPIDALGQKDPYDESLVDPAFDDYMLNQMFNAQDEYEHERKVGYARFINSKIGQIDVESDPEKGGVDDIFKKNSGVVVDLENFQTIMKTKGFDASKHLENNIEASVKELVTHLKKKSKFPIAYEKLDPALLVTINGIQNDDVSNFHRDNFLYFRDFSLELKRNEVEAKQNASS